MHSRQRNALYLAPFHRLFHCSLCLIPSSTASSHCPPFSCPAGNLLWPFQLKEALPANPISCDRCDGEGPIKARRAAVSSPIGAQTPLRFDSWLLLSPLRSPLVSLTLPALQRGRGNGCEVCFTPGRERREKGNEPAVIPSLANLPLVFCDCQQQKLIILKKRKKERMRGHSSTLCDIVLQHGQSLYPDSSVRSHRVSVWKVLLGIQPSAADERLLSLLSYDPPQDDDGDDDDDYN